MKSSDLSFLAPPHEVSDWRMVLLVSAAHDAGLLDALPGRPGDLAVRLGLDGHAVMVVLEALAQFGVVQGSEDGTYSAGPSALDADQIATLYHHGRAMAQWARTLDDAVRGAPRAPAAPPRLDRWIGSLAVYARRSAPAVVDACLARLPGTTTVLDLGGGHGEHALEFARRGLSVTLQDRPAMIDIARRSGIVEAGGVRLFAADFFEAVAPGPFDLVFCSGVTNTFGAERNLELYRQVHPRLAPGGCLVIQTSMRDRQPASALFGVQMLVVGNGGDAHPERLYREWLGSTGYGPVDIHDVDDGRRSLLFAPAIAST
jgi:SAM-dependent methyltransferase